MKQNILTGTLEYNMKDNNICRLSCPQKKTQVHRDYMFFSTGFNNERYLKEKKHEKLSYKFISLKKNLSLEKLSLLSRFICIFFFSLLIHWPTEWASTTTVGPVLVLFRVVGLHVSFERVYLNEIQSTKVKEVRNGMTKDVLLDSNWRVTRVTGKWESNKIKEIAKTLDLAA